jgi:hypothetical protein
LPVNYCVFDLIIDGLTQLTNLGFLISAKGDLGRDSYDLLI